MAGKREKNVISYRNHPGPNLGPGTITEQERLPFLRNAMFSSSFARYLSKPKPVVWRVRCLIEEKKKWEEKWEGNPPWFPGFPLARFVDKQFPPFSPFYRDE